MCSHFCDRKLVTAIKTLLNILTTLLKLESRKSFDRRIRLPILLDRPSRLPKRSWSRGGCNQGVFLNSLLNVRYMYTISKSLQNADRDSDPKGQNEIYDPATMWQGRK